jgi:hypothetical protein
MDTEKIKEICDKYLGFDADAVVHLYNWCYDTDWWFPLQAFQDLIGFSEEYFGGPIKDWTKPSQGLGHMEMSLLAQALEAYTNRPSDIFKAVKEIQELLDSSVEV